MTGAHPEGRPLHHELLARGATLGRRTPRRPPVAAGGRRVRLVTDELVHGFVWEPIGIEGALDISACGGWRSYLTKQAAGQNAPPSGS